MSYRRLPSWGGTHGSDGACRLDDSLDDFALNAVVDAIACKAGNNPVLSPPPAEDLHALYKLCGGSEGLLAHHLAKIYGVTPSELSPTVASWLIGVPEIVPPSRQRSAPPVMAPEARCNAGARNEPGLLPPSSALPTGAPPLSAPAAARLCGQDLMLAMRAIDARLNHSASSARDSSWDARLCSLPQSRVVAPARSTVIGGPALAAPSRGWLALQRVPEETPVTGEQSAGRDPSVAAARYLQRTSDDDAASRYLEHAYGIHDAARLAAPLPSVPPTQLHRGSGGGLPAASFGRVGSRASLLNANYRPRVGVGR